MSDAVIRRLDRGDLAAIVALAESVDWNGERHRYELLLDVGDVFGIDDHGVDGGLIGTVTVTRFGGELASVGMMLVDPRHGRHGHGRALMQHAMAVAGDAVVVLYATSAGRPLYEKLGFVALGSNASYRGSFRGSGCGSSDLAAPADLSGVIELDREVTGCDRARLLTRYFSFAEEIRVLRAGGTITGFGGRWRHGDHTVVGPLVAPDRDRAVALAGDLASRAAGAVRIDVGEPGSPLSEWAGGHGLSHAGTTTLMTRGGRALPGDRGRWFMPVTLALG